MIINIKVGKKLNQSYTLKVTNKRIQLFLYFMHYKFYNKKSEGKTKQYNLLLLEPH